MTKFSLLFDSPPWLIGVGILMGIAYALILYYKSKGPWGKKLNILLALLRFMLVTQLTLLLFGPLIRQIKNTFEPPAIVLAIDNSTSVTEVMDSTELSRLMIETSEGIRALEDKGYITEIRTLDLQSPVQSEAGVKYTSASTDLTAMISTIQSDYESRNLSSVVLVSDGLYNRGLNPTFRPFNFTIHTLGIGDTVQRPDINLNTILYNKIAYQGNKFPIVAELLTTGLNGREVTVRVENRGRVLDSQTVKISELEQFDQIKFVFEAESTGMQRYKVTAVPLSEEYIQVNNYKEAFIDIIEGREKILIAAPAPHPDIKALKKAIEKNKNYEVAVYIPGISTLSEESFDAAILHQVPDKKQQFQSLLTKLEKENTPIWFIIGKQSDLRRLGSMNEILDIKIINNQQDKAFPVFNKDFGTFQFQDLQKEVLNDYPPIDVPFANYTFKGNTEVLINQRVGNISTSKPLLVIKRGSTGKSAMLLGEGFWKWRLQEYAKNQNQDVFDDIVSKVIQFLSTKEDKRKFKVYPIKNEFYNNEAVIFNTEVYNDIYEKTYGYKIELSIADESGEKQGYTYVTSESNSRYRVNGLEKGIYQFGAEAIINGERESVSGSFTINELQIENTKLKADHNLLRNLAEASGGQFFLPPQTDELLEQLAKVEPQQRIFTSEDYMAIINMKWGFFILIFFASAEWFLRKYFGSY